MQKAADRIVLARYGPAGVVINDRLEVLHVRGHTAPYLEMSPGTASLHLLRMIREGFGPALRLAIQRAITEDVPAVAEDLYVGTGSEALRFKADVLPMTGVAGRPRTYLVVFLPTPSVAPSAPAGPLGEPAVGATAEELTREVTKLRHDIASTRAYLHSLVEEREGRNQELTSAYEELQSANEELQSTNEELETAKEELQSANEELHTVNEELRNRNIALMHASNDLSNLLISVNIPVVMFGGDLTIRQYTPPAEKLMQIHSSDLGRRIGEVRLNLSIEQLEPVVQEVLDTLGTKEMEVQDHDGHWHLLRVRPYRTTDNKIDGVVMVLLDIDQIRRGEEAMRASRDFLEAVVETVHLPLAILDGELRIQSANAAFRSLTTLPKEEVERRSFPEFAALLWKIPELRPRLEAVRTGSADQSFDMEYEMPGDVARTFRFAARPVQFHDEKWVLLIIEDITDRKQVERLLQRDRDRLSGEVSTTAEALERSQQELRALAARLFTSHEEESRRVARDLHDDVSQKLAMIEIDMEQLRKDLPKDPKEARRRIEGIRNRIGALSSEVRAISHGLHPSVLEDLGLPHALKTLVEDFGVREAMPATFSRRRIPESIGRETATALYRITQEALRNVAKHAGKTHVKVVLEGNDEGLRLTVRDFGDGFDLREPGNNGLGLISMKERARLVNGAWSIDSELGEGTTVTVTVPSTPAPQEG